MEVNVKSDISMKQDAEIQQYETWKIKLQFCLV
jgi:hypothetical protein